MPTPETKQALTPDQRRDKQKTDLREMRQRQQKNALEGKPRNEGEAMVEGNRDKGYKLPAHESHLVHVRVVTRQNNDATKQYDVIDQVVKFHKNQFDQVIKENTFAPYDEAKVLHDPRPNAPKAYNLKPFDVKPTTGLPANDAQLAAREQKLKEREKALDEKMAAIDQKLAELDKKTGGQPPAK